MNVYLWYMTCAFAIYIQIYEDAVPSPFANDRGPSLPKSIPSVRPTFPNIARCWHQRESISKSSSNSWHVGYPRNQTWQWQPGKSHMWEKVLKKHHAGKIIKYLLYIILLYIYRSYLSIYSLYIQKSMWQRKVEDFSRKQGTKPSCSGSSPASKSSKPSKRSRRARAAKACGWFSVAMSGRYRNRWDDLT